MDRVSSDIVTLYLYQIDLISLDGVNYFNVIHLIVVIHNVSVYIIFMGHEIG